MASVAVTFAALDAEPDALRACWGILDRAERIRAGKFRFERDRRRFILRRGRLRRLLAAHTGTAAAELRFQQNGFGKPRLAAGPHFSLSHSAERMMVAISDVEVGCDIERIDPALMWGPLAESLFAPGERASLEKLSAAAARTAFFHCWARKEAFVKALGLGLSHPLEAFVVSVRADARLIAGGEGWAMAAVEAGAGYAAAVATRDDGLPLVIRTSESTSAIASRANATVSPA